MSATIQPVRFLDMIAIQRGPIARLGDIERDARLSKERDLREAPTPISGGMRKALHVEQIRQDFARGRYGLPIGTIDNRKSYGLLIATCRHCRHSMFFDEIEDLDSAIRCDRCRREA